MTLTVHLFDISIDFEQSSVRRLSYLVDFEIPILGDLSELDRIPLYLEGILLLSFH